MNSHLKYFAELSQPLVVLVAGRDARRVLNNLTTNDVIGLAETGLETFVTDVRGRCVAHGEVVVTVEGDGVLFMGRHDDSQRVCNHIDKYIVTEDARVSDLSASHRLLALLPSEKAQPDHAWSGFPGEHINASNSVVAIANSRCYGPHTRLLCVADSALAEVAKVLTDDGLTSVP